jgi:hypothetical protein
MRSENWATHTPTSHEWRLELPEFRTYDGLETGASGLKNSQAPALPPPISETGIFRQFEVRHGLLREV